MNKLKEMNGRYYQECEVVMLDTDKANIGEYILGITNEEYPQRLFYGKKIQEPYNCSQTNYNLYFLSNEEIKEGDYVIDSMGELFGPYEKGDIIGKEAKKIIATTDIPLQLPQPSKEFIQAYIKAYNENKPITKVLVEMKELDSQDYHSEIDYFGKTDIKLEYELKINSSNEITIKKIKDSYTREEVIDLLEEYRIHLDDFPSVRTSEKYLTNWIEKYL